jgi:hypothetical protein
MVWVPGSVGRTRYRNGRRSSIAKNARLSFAAREWSRPRRTVSGSGARGSTSGLRPDAAIGEPAMLHRQFLLSHRVTQCGRQER